MVHSCVTDYKFTFSCNEIEFFLKHMDIRFCVKEIHIHVTLIKRKKKYLQKQLNIWGKISDNFIYYLHIFGKGEIN